MVSEKTKIRAKKLRIPLTKTINGKRKQKTEKKLINEINKRKNKKSGLRNISNKSVKTPKGWNPSSYRNTLPENCFLDYPKYPFCGQNKQPDCKGLLAANKRAVMNKNQKLISKSKRLGKRYGCEWTKKSRFGNENVVIENEHKMYVDDMFTEKEIYDLDLYNFNLTIYDLINIREQLDSHYLEELLENDDYNSDNTDYYE